MAGENSHLPAQNEWEMLSMTGSSLGLPPAKPQNSESAEEDADPAKKRELPEHKEEHPKDPEPCPDAAHEDLVFTDDRNVVAPVDSDQMVKVSWWKRKINFGQSQSEKYNAMLSIALVAAVLGIAVIGHRWHRERNQNHQLRLELAAKEEKLSEMVHQFKEAVTGRRRIGVSKSSFF